MKREIVNLQNTAQTPGEREAISELVKTRLEAHEEKDDMRFNELNHTIETKLDLILKMLNK